MKTFFVLLLVFVAFKASAQYPETGTVTISNSSNKLPAFKISLDGDSLSDLYFTSVIFKDLSGDEHQVRIQQAGSDKILNFDIKNQMGYVTEYLLNGSNGLYSLQFLRKYVPGFEKMSGYKLYKE